VPLSWQLTWQLRFACAWQLPWHSAWQVTGVQLGGVPLQLPLQLESQVSLQEAEHSAMFWSLAHWPEQWPLQSVSHEPSQLKLPDVQPPVQLLTHEAVQFASMLALHIPLQLASRSAEHWSWKFGAVHCVLQSAEAARLQVVPASRSTPPQSVRMTAWAVPGKKATRAPSIDAAATAKNEGRENIGSLLMGLSLKPRPASSPDVVTGRAPSGRGGRLDRSTPGLPGLFTGW
jgi:hypothetical protein